jgi:hypothetical protein
MIYSADRKEADKADRMLLDMKESADFYRGLEDIKLSSLTKALAYDKDVISFLVECSGKPLKSSGLLE